jgi:glutamate--cysteine ligase catalytic subunit
VTYSKDDPKVLLSLRQADILTALAADEELVRKGGCVPALQELKGHDQ